MVSVLVAIHAVCGLGGLLVLPVPLLVRYGDRVHRAFGRLFVGAMAGAAGSGLSLAALWVVAPGWARPGADPAALRAYGLFLAYLGLLLISNVWGGVAAWRVAGPDPVARGLAAALAAGGLALVLAGLAQGSWLFGAFGALGASAGIGALRRRTATDRRERHAQAMFGAAIAASTAFLVLGLRRWVEVPDLVAPLAWVGPTLVGVPLQWALLRQDRLRRDPARRTLAA